MKKLLIILNLLFFVGYYAQQNDNITEGEVVYKVVSKIKNTKEIEKKVSDSLNVSQSKMSEFFGMIFNNKPAEYSILFKGNKALSIPKLSPEAKTKSGFNMIQILLEKKGIYYADFSNNTVYNDREFSGKDIIIDYKISDLKWNITNETMKTPEGNKLTKAIAKYKFEKDNGKLIIREVTAWFAEDIPVRVAPLQFYGLPGLVVKLEIEGMSFSLSSINSKKVNVDYKIDPKKVITEDQYMDLTNEIN